MQLGHLRWLMTVLMTFCGACFFITIFPFFLHPRNAFVSSACFPTALLGQRIIYSQLLSINTRITRSQWWPKKRARVRMRKKGVYAYKRARDTLFWGGGILRDREVRVTCYNPIWFIGLMTHLFDVWFQIATVACNKFLLEDARRYRFSVYFIKENIYFFFSWIVEYRKKDVYRKRKTFIILRVRKRFCKFV